MSENSHRNIFIDRHENELEVNDCFIGDDLKLYCIRKLNPKCLNDKTWADVTDGIFSTISRFNRHKEGYMKTIWQSDWIIKVNPDVLFIYTNIKDMLSDIINFSLEKNVKINTNRLQVFYREKFWELIDNIKIKDAIESIKTAEAIWKDCRECKFEYDNLVKELSWKKSKFTKKGFF
jgi:mRNA-degrading endonuclease YafQ of YafQ-DinJ toxin-antitoxin module